MERKARRLNWNIVCSSKSGKVKKQIERLQKLAAAIAELDCLQSFASVSEDNHFVCPTLVSDSHDLEIKAGWHPSLNAFWASKAMCRMMFQCRKDAIFC